MILRGPLGGGLPILLAVTAAAAAGATNEFQVAVDGLIELPCADCDGVALGDINGNGRMDILASSGKHAEVFWFEQGEDFRHWTKRPIYRQPGEAGEIEGNDLADFDGDGNLEAVSLDQPNGRVLLHKLRDLGTDRWETAVIQGERPFLQVDWGDLGGSGRGGDLVVGGFDTTVIFRDHLPERTSSNSR